MSANSKQVGGSHYAKGGEFQHWDLITNNYGPGYLIGCATKYLTRWREKGGRQDLEKALHYIEKLQEKVARGEAYPPAVMTEGLEEFLTSNRVDGPEADAIRLLMSWHQPRGHVRQLREAWEIVDGMIKDA